MRVLFWIFIGLDRHETSEHLLVSIIEQLCKSGHEVHILQKYTGGNLPSIPETLDEYSVTTDIIPFEAASKGNFAARYIKELKYVKNVVVQTADAIIAEAFRVNMMLFLFNLIR